jgi:hypothetical protein
MSIGKFLLMAAGRRIVVGTPTKAGAAMTSTLTISKPVGVAAGSLLVAFVIIDGAYGVKPPAGWTELRDSNRRSVHIRQVDGTEGDSFTWVFTGAQDVQGFIVPLSGAQLDVCGDFGPTASPAVAPSVTAAADNSLAMAWFSENNAGVSFSTPAGWTALVADTDAADNSGAIFTKAVNAGAVGAASSTSSPIYSSRAIEIVFKPK